MYYSTEDSITYTRSSSYPEKVTFPFPFSIKEESKIDWVNTIGEFIKISTNKFEGLYKYKSTLDMSNFLVINNIRTDSTEHYDVLNEVLSVDDYRIIDQALELAIFNTFESSYLNFNGYLLEKIDDNTYYAYIYTDGQSNADPCMFLAVENEENTTIHISTDEVKTDSNKDIYIYKIDLLTKQATLHQHIPYSDLSKADYSSDSFYGYINEEITSDRKFVMNLLVTKFLKIYTSSSGYSNMDIEIQFASKEKYYPDNGQLSLVNASSLIINNTALGANGVITGTAKAYINKEINNCICTNTSKSYNFRKVQILQICSGYGEDLNTRYDSVFVALMIASTGDTTFYSDCCPFNLVFKNKEDEVIYKMNCDQTQFFYHQDWSNVISDSNDVLMYQLGNISDLYDLCKLLDFIDQIEKVELTFLNFE